MYSIKEVAQLAGLSIKTLQYYDEINLLKPKRAENGYRQYSDEDLEQLQEILTYRYLKFSLTEIKSMLEDKKSIESKLNQQLYLLEKEKQHLQAIIETLQLTLINHQGGVCMPADEKFRGFSWADQDPYEQEVIEKYGEATIRQSKVKSQPHQEHIETEMNRIFFALADFMQEGRPVDSLSSQEEVDKLFRLFNDYIFDCPLEVFGQIGQGYVQDDRFENNIDKFGHGTAEYASGAIAYYVNNTGQ